MIFCAEVLNVFIYLIVYIFGCLFLDGLFDFSLQIHFGPVKVMKYNHVFDTVISADDKGIIEYWNPNTLQFPEDGYVSISRCFYIPI